jgi:MFS family permease
VSNNRQSAISNQQSAQVLNRDTKEDTSIWLALRNRVFVGLWVASVVSGCCVAAHDTAAMWLMNATGASPFMLSLIATSASLPFFLFTLPAGSVADLVDRRRLFIGTYIWLGCCAGLLAVLTWFKLVNPYIILVSVFLLGIGFAFNAPVWAAIIPEIVRKRELASAVTLGGVQLNLASIVGPAVGGLLLSIVGPPVLFALNSVAFFCAAGVIARRYRDRRRPEPHLENFLESFATALRYVRYAPGMQIILIRDCLFAVFIAAIPALTPVVAFQQLQLEAAQLGMVYTSLAIGSLVGATVVLPVARARATPNMLTILAGWLLVMVYLLMSVADSVWWFLPIAALAGISWTVAAAELWVAGQRAMPDWARGRMNAVHMMVSQGGIAVGGVLWGWATTHFGVSPALLSGAILLAASLFIAVPLSINFSQRLNLDRAPLQARHNFPFAPELQDGPVAVTVEYEIRPEDREEFLNLTRQLRLIFLRNGAFLYRVDECLEHPGTFRTEMHISSWAEHLRQHERTTREENALFAKAWQLHSGPEEPRVRHHLPADRTSTPLGFGQFRQHLAMLRGQPAGEEAQRR